MPSDKRRAVREVARTTVQQPLQRQLDKYLIDTRRNLELVAGTEPSLLSNSNPHPAPLLDLPKPLTRSSLAIHPQGVALGVPSAIAPSETHLVGGLS